MNVQGDHFEKERMQSELFPRCRHQSKRKKTSQTRAEPDNAQILEPTKRNDEREKGKSSVRACQWKPEKMAEQAGGACTVRRKEETSWRKEDVLLTDPEVRR